MKKTVQHTSKSLKTFYLYTTIVLILIAISLAIKAFFVIEQSKVDAAHNFTLAVLEQQKVKEVISFHPQTPSLSLLVIQDKDIPYETLAQKYGIATDGYIQADDNMHLGTNIASFMWSSLMHTALWQSDLTAFDKIRLLFLAKSVTPNNKNVEDISLTQQTPEFNTLIASALADQDISNENISIQVINATNISGFGQRLGRVLTNMGANVVDVSSAQNIQEKTTLAYYGNDSYTIRKLQKFLGVQATKLSRQPIADIVITIGLDKSNTTKF